MDDWKYSAHVDQSKQAEQDDALKAAGVDRHHSGPQPKTAVRPLTPEMKRFLRRNYRRSKVGIFALAMLFLFLALVSLVGGFGSGVDGIRLGLSFGGTALTVALLGFGIRWLLQADLRRGTYSVAEGWIATRIEVYPKSGTSDYMMNIGGREWAVNKEEYDAAGTITRGTVTYVGLASTLEIRDEHGKMVYHRKGYTPADPA